MAETVGLDGMEETEKPRLVHTQLDQVQKPRLICCDQNDFSLDDGLTSRLGKVEPICPDDGSNPLQLWPRREQ